MTSRRTAGSDDPGHLRSFMGTSLVRVRGRSMEPTLYGGDVLLVRSGSRTAPGDLVVVRLPGERPIAVKRAVRRDDSGWWVERDNPREGVDSWSLGAVSEGDVLGQVVLRIWPLRRRPKL